ncbi:hypothetical protein RHMOL_Rhmol11G0031500 [Rhododendron molle]|uniref:Uncharacterized protein n=1 Tax=Rhododendron molle TaxID=49168 RepID=A0ACC0LP74_RHOML|nr:hypothetical protein RHMOL_Rhmol11G0031500 [Rhododendron molle]
MVAEMEVPIRLFPAGYQVDEAYHPLLNAIARRHPEMFAHFNLRSAQLGVLFFRDLHEVLAPWAQLRFGDFTTNTETVLQDVAQDAEVMGSCSNRGDLTLPLLIIVKFRMINTG